MPFERDTNLQRYLTHKGIILFFYDEKGYLSGITDSVGRELEVITNN